MARTKRTTINLDRDLRNEASDASTNDVVRRRKLEALTKMEFPDMTLEKLKEMRRPRTFDHLRRD